MLVASLLLSWVLTWCVVAAAVSLPTWLLWNWLMPELFGLPSINFFQAFGLLLLSGFLFGDRPSVKVGAKD
jgi:hypothetical protein